MNDKSEPGRATRMGRTWLVAAVLAATALAAGPAVAVPVQISGWDSYDYTIVKSSVTGHAGGVVDILGQEGYWTDTSYHGGGGVYANAWASYYFIGADAVAVGTLNWSVHFDAPDRPLDVYMDWDAQFLVGASAILGAAGGGGLLETWVYQEFGAPISFPFPVGHLKNVYSDSAVAGEVTQLAHLVPGEEWWMTFSFQTGAAASTASVIGIAAEADAFGFLGFDVWADDGTLPPTPVAEPGTLWLFAGVLPLLVLAGRRRSAMAVAPPGLRSAR